MLDFSGPLASLAAYRQFIVCQFVPSATRPGKTDKFPIDHRTGRRADAHDPTIWLTGSEAIEAARSRGDGFGVGFVFTTADPFFFIDIDDCLTPGGWSPLARDLCTRFAGAAVEISQSGRGLHIIAAGNAGKPDERRKKALGFDLYTEARFVALTGTSLMGDAWTDHTAALTALVAEHLQRAPGETVEGWTTAPCPEWRGPDDDARLIDRARRSQSAAGAFGNRATFEDLWTANETVLTRVYPADRGGGYDASKADSGLAQHLAFWTGKDCARIERLMWQSKLAREKWSREDYLPRTVSGVVARQRDVLQDKPTQERTATPSAQAVGAAHRGELVTGETFLSVDEQLKMFEGCVYVCDQHKVLVPGAHLLKPDQFKVMFGGYSFPMDASNERVVRNAWEAFTESQCFRSPRADGLCFRPDQPPAALIEDGGRVMVNTWWPINTPAAAGDAGPFLQHVGKLLPNGRDADTLLAYMAAIRQYPGVKFQWAPVIQGVEGNGKTFLITAVSRSVGERYSHMPNAHDLGGNGTKFTGWIRSKIFIGIEEIYTADRRETLEAVKALITNSRIEIQGKGEDQVTGDNRANFMVATNHKDGVPKTANDRRWALFFTAQQSVADLVRDGMTGNYMPDLWDWFEGRNRYAGQTPGAHIVNHYLQTYPIPDELNPAKGMHRAPETSSTAEARTMSLGAVEQEIMEAIDQALSGFANGWVSSMALEKLLIRLKAERRIPPAKRREMMQSIGYDYHPSLPDGRVHNVVFPDGGRTKLFVKHGHLSANVENPALVARMYSEAQASAVTDGIKFGT